MKKLFVIFFIGIFLSSMAKDMKTKDGKTYHNYSLISLSWQGMKIRHSKGISYIQFENLPDDIQKKYNKTYIRNKPRYELEKKQYYAKLKQEKENARIRAMILHDVRRQRILQGKSPHFINGSVRAIDANSIKGQKMQSRKFF